MSNEAFSFSMDKTNYEVRQIVYHEVQGKIRIIPALTQDIFDFLKKCGICRP
jgi:hypothetical protein